MKGEGGRKKERLVAHGGRSNLRFLSSLVRRSFSGLRRPSSDLRHRLYEILEHGPVGGGKGNIVARLIVALIAVNLVAVVAESVPAIEEQYRQLFSVIEWVSLVVLTVDYGLRLWLADQHIPYRHLRPAAARWRYAVSVPGVIDLIAVLPFWIALVVPADLRVLLIFRVIRFLKLGRYSPGMRSLLDVLYAERRALTGCFVILIGASLIAATVMHLVERHAQPDKFGTIPDAMWWAIVTLGTIGYGDVVPVTPLGRLVAAVTIFTGLIMIALPVGIIATAFAEQIHRRDFIITWSMVARVPLFAGLNAADIADIMRLLRAQTVEPGAMIVRRGEAAHCMYFIAAGEVEIELATGPVHLGVGHFFGEIAVLRRARRSATVIARTRTSLLGLDAHDLHALMERDPRVAERIRGVVRGRLGHELVTPHGDLVTEEIEDIGDALPPGGMDPVRPV
jgi:voltage-gated potassium channel